MATGLELLLKRAPGARTGALHRERATERKQGIEEKKRGFIEGPTRALSRPSCVLPKVDYYDRPIPYATRGPILRS